MTLNQLAAYFLASVLIVGVIVELVIVALNLREFGTLNSEARPTISRFIWRLSQKHPWIPFIAGALTWHFLGS